METFNLEGKFLNQSSRVPEIVGDSETNRIILKREMWIEKNVMGNIVKKVDLRMLFKKMDCVHNRNDEKNFS